MLKHYNLCLAFLETILEMEKTPFTQNTHYLESCTEKWFSKYKDAKAGKGDGKNSLTDEALSVKEQREDGKNGLMHELQPLMKKRMSTTKWQEQKWMPTENPFASFGEFKKPYKVAA